jgi:hypothetical protein
MSVLRRFKDLSVFYFFALTFSSIIFICGTSKCNEHQGFVGVLGTGYAEYTHSQLDIIGKASIFHMHRRKTK